VAVLQEARCNAYALQNSAPTAASANSKVAHDDTCTFAGLAFDFAQAICVDLIHESTSIRGSIITSLENPRGHTP
jgi:hypothetical protein